jgi:hypothetical protein
MIPRHRALDRLPGHRLPVSLVQTRIAGGEERQSGINVAHRLLIELLLRLLGLTASTLHLSRSFLTSCFPARRAGYATSEEQEAGPDSVR